MENGVLYTHQLDFGKVVAIVKKHLPKAEVVLQEEGITRQLRATQKGGIFSKAVTLTINWRQRLKPSYQLQDADCALSKNLRGMMGLVQKLPLQNADLKSRMLMKVGSLNGEMAWLAETGFHGGVLDAFKEAALALDCIAFVNPGPAFGRSTVQYFADRHLRLLLDMQGRSEVDTLEVVVDAKYRDPDPGGLTEAQQRRKAGSMEVLAGKGVNTNRNLPCVEDDAEVQLRTPEEIASRAYCLLFLAFRGEGAPLRELEPEIARMALRAFTPEEMQVLAAEELSAQQQAYATWRYEGLNVLLWALGAMPALEWPDKICDVPQLVTRLRGSDPAGLAGKAALRSISEILDAKDLHYRMHWACVDARLKGTVPGARIEPGVVYERMYALNWLTREADAEWDDVEVHS